MRIAVLTGGGDVPGLNPCIQSITKSALQRNWEVIGFKRGWAGVLEINPDDPTSFDQHLYRLDADMVRGIDRMGGTILHSSRKDPRSDSRGDQTDKILSIFDQLQIDALITMGGDGTLRFSAHLSELGLNVISIPKTMDNDVFGTDYCIGFSTAVTRSVDAINSLRTTCASHERIAFVELFGRRSGETALLSGFLSQADRTAIAEVPVDVDELTSLIINDKYSNPERYAICVVSEGAKIAGQSENDELSKSANHRKITKIGTRLSQQFEQHTGEAAITQEIGYLMRAGEPDALDRMVGFAFGSLAVQLIEEQNTGKMLNLKDGKYGFEHVGQLLKGTKRVDTERLYNSDEYRASLVQTNGMPMFLY